MQLEKRRPLGTENIHGLLHAIKNKLIIKFTYRKFWEDQSSERIVEPFVLKEFKNRWYLLAKETQSNRIKTFALDRLIHLDFTSEKFENSRIAEIEEIYQNCFGIISPNDEDELQKVILSFTSDQIKYIKTLPLHDSQTIISENDKESIIQLKLYVTYDFIQELLTHGKEVKVIEPTSLQDRLKKEYQEAFEQY
jgi:predicted DNA-binding transcriptional regulator YafY